jgi:hypothetical protein
MITYIGWIKAWPWAWRRLRTLGVQGPMRYNWRNRVFQHCHCRHEIMIRLMSQFPGFWPGCFTGVDEAGKQLPHDKQIFWKIEHENLMRNVK